MPSARDWTHTRRRTPRQLSGARRRGRSSAPAFPPAARVCGHAPRRGAVRRARRSAAACRGLATCRPGFLFPGARAAQPERFARTALQSGERALAALAALTPPVPPGNGPDNGGAPAAGATPQAPSCHAPTAADATPMDAQPMPDAPPADGADVPMDVETAQPDARTPAAREHPAPTLVRHLSTPGPSAPRPGRGRAGRHGRVARGCARPDSARPVRAPRCHSARHPRPRRRRGPTQDSSCARVLHTRRPRPCGTFDA